MHISDYRYIENVKMDIVPIKIEVLGATLTKSAIVATKDKHKWLRAYFYQTDSQAHMAVGRYTDQFNRNQIDIRLYKAIWLPLENPND